MQNHKVQDFIARDVWAIADGQIESGPFIIRYRQPVLAPADVSEYPRCLRILWAYADENLQALPEEADSNAMAIFEDRLCDALEHDALAVLVAVLTLDGARQWVFYTSDLALCGERINSMLQAEDLYPIELDAFTDESWNYLREQILGPVNRGLA